MFDLLYSNQTKETVMNLMCLIGKESEIKKTRIKQITEEKQQYGIQITPFDKPSKESKDCKYYHNAVPDIPYGYDVMSRWGNYISMCVNWSGDEIANLSSGYGFTFAVSPLIPDDLYKEFSSWFKDKDPRQSTIPYSIASRLPKKTYCTVVFDNEADCVKHLKWFKRCFLMTLEQDGSEREAKLYNYGANNG